MIRNVKGLATQLEVEPFVNLEVPEEPYVEMVESRPVDCTALLVANLNRGRGGGDERRTIEPIQTGVNPLTVAIIRIQHLVRAQRRGVRTVHDTQARRVVHLAAVR